MISPDQVDRWRAEFPILGTHTYLNSCSLGALSRRAMGNLDEFQHLWNTMGASAWYELWLGRIDELRARVARLMGARIAEIALVPSVSAGLSSLSTTLDYWRRPRVIIADLDFPTVAHQWLAKPEVELVVLPSRDGIGIELDQWAGAIDERTAAVVTSHVFYSTGFVQDIASIGRLAGDAGALSIVDGYHGLGQLPANPREMGIDAYLTGPLKWMLGGPGLAWVWVREEKIEALTPRIASWFGVRDQFGFDGENLELRPDAGRFTMGTPALPTVYTALAGAEIIEQVGLPTIRDRIAGLVEQFTEMCADREIAVRLPRPDARSGIVMLPDPGAKKTVARLADDGFIVDSRGPFVRVSPHFYNLAEELEALADRITALR